jgi:hypothetical protein
VWCFQELARRIGGERYRTRLARADYGRFREPFDETTFWLDGSLTISARERVAERRAPEISGTVYVIRMPGEGQVSTRLRTLAGVVPASAVGRPVPGRSLANGPGLGGRSPTRSGRPAY